MHVNSYVMHLLCILQYSLVQDILQYTRIHKLTCMTCQLLTTLYTGNGQSTVTLIVFHNRIFPKNWGGQMHYWPPQSVLGGGPWPPWPPPVADPMVYTYIYKDYYEYTENHSNTFFNLQYNRIQYLQFYMIIYEILIHV